MNKKRVILGIGVTVCLSVSSFFYFQNSATRNLSDEALLSIIKNDQKGFENYLNAGGTVNTLISMEDDSYLVGELLVKYNRLGFVKYAKSKNLVFESDLLKDFDVYSLSVTNNNPEMLTLILGDQKLDKYNKYFGDQGWTLLQLACAECSYKVIGVLHKAGMKWDEKNSKGTTALTVAAESGCLQALSYFKEQGADFSAKDGRGMSALAILSKKKDAALMAFADSFMDRRSPASIVTTVVKEVVPNFYKKRQIPKDTLADRAHLIEPSDRPDDANETAENSEFSD